MAKGYQDSNVNEVIQSANRLAVNETASITVSPYLIKKMLLRTNIITSCTRVCRYDFNVQCDFENVNDWFQYTLTRDKNESGRKFQDIICNNQINRTISEDIYSWLHDEEYTTFTQYLPYLIGENEVTFQQCYIEEHYPHGHVLKPMNRNHNLFKTIYYTYDQSTRTIVDIFITDDNYINLIKKKLSLQKDADIEHKIILYSILILKCVKETECVSFHQHLLSLSKWKTVHRVYKRLMKLRSFDELDLYNSLLYSRCLIKLSKYSQANEVLTNLKNKIKKLNEKKIAEFWYLYAIAQRKYRPSSINLQTNQRQDRRYIAAQRSILFAIAADPENDEVKKEQLIINKLIGQSNSNDTIVQHFECGNYKKDYRSYNILSIDGGGIRGIIPAIWLSKLEHRTNRSCSSMFQMMAGTSTGAIIAAGLSLPKAGSLTEPDINALKLVEIYKTHGEHIFFKKNRHRFSYRNFSPSLATKYSSTGKQTLFEKYFRQTLLRDCLTDIVIPAVRLGDTYTHLFTRNYNYKSTSIVDVLMATTAAPTYFKPHNFDGICYTDGGVQVNNPTMAAYEKALEYGYDREHICVLSLGTGDYIQDPLPADIHWDIASYASYSDVVIKFLLDSQQHNVDKQMTTLMNDRHYHRWQVCFEKAVALDQYDAETLTYLEDSACEYWEEMEIHDENRLYKLIEHLTSEEHT
ncbi:hypothetical protein I4U23_015293 [Adineta vaga]|nr:hypothetical protein I4U23_015293 [Adineta vaga]